MRETSQRTSLGRHFAYRRHLHRRLDERALQELIAEVYDRRQIRASADPTALLMKNMHLGVSFATQERSPTRMRFGRALSTGPCRQPVRRYREASDCCAYVGTALMPGQPETAGYSQNALLRRRTFMLIFAELRWCWARRSYREQPCMPASFAGMQLNWIKADSVLAHDPIRRQTLRRATAMMPSKQMHSRYSSTTFMALMIAMLDL